jgi:hypothetical protein
MALSDSATNSLAGLWGSYDFYLIRDGHFKNASDMVERFLDRYQSRWKDSPRTRDKEFVNNPKKVRELLTEWAEKKLADAADSQALATIQSNIMFKQLHYANQTINFGSINTNWKKKVEIAAELAQYKPWSVAHAAATLGGKKKLRKHVESILAGSGSTREKEFFDAWWDLTDDGDRPMLFPQVFGHTTGKLFVTNGKESSFPAKFSFGLINVASRSKVLIQCLPKSSSIDAAAEALLTEKRKLADQGGWLLFEFSNSQVKNQLSECFKALEDFLTY